jgi:hypothetical protein
MEEVADQIEQFRRETQLIQRLFPQATGLSKLTEKANYFAGQIKQLPPHPDATVFSLLADLEEQADWLHETKRDCLASLRRRISDQANRLPDFSSQHETLLGQVCIWPN